MLGRGASANRGFVTPGWLQAGEGAALPWHGLMALLSGTAAASSVALFNSSGAGVFI